MDESAFGNKLLRGLIQGDTVDINGWKIGWQEHQGSRKQQQDSVGVVLGSFQGRPAVMAILADGMGGMKDGKAFSATVIDYFYQAFQSELDKCKNSRGLLLALAYGANKAANTIYNPDKPGGTTLVAALFIEDKLYTLSIGDSRICLFRLSDKQRDPVPLQLNREHILGYNLDERAWMGFLSFEDAEDNMFRDSLTSCLGPETIRHIDLQGDPISLRPHDRVVLMSDGIFRTLPELEMASSMKLQPQAAADDVVKRVLESNAPHQDNMSIIIVERVFK